MVILIDNGHGKETAGKRSPDGSLMEWKYCREVAQELHDILNASGVRAKLLVPEDEDIPLKERVRRANRHCAFNDCILVSIHVNAAWKSGWHHARGFSAFVAPNASPASVKLAAALTQTFRAAKFEGNRLPGPENCYRGNYAIIRDTRCPAVLTENLFMDNKQDVEYLLKPESVKQIAALHARALIKIINEK